MTTTVTVRVSGPKYTATVSQPGRPDAKIKGGEVEQHFGVGENTPLTVVETYTPDEQPGQATRD